MLIHFGVVVSVPAFRAGDPSSNLAGTNEFFCIYFLSRFDIYFTIALNDKMTNFCINTAPEVRDCVSNGKDGAR